MWVRLALWPACSAPESVLCWSPEHVCSCMCGLSSSRWVRLMPALCCAVGRFSPSFKSHSQHAAQRSCARAARRPSSNWSGWDHGQVVSDFWIRAGRCSGGSALRTFTARAFVVRRRSVCCSRCGRLRWLRFPGQVPRRRSSPYHPGDRD